MTAQQDSKVNRDLAYRRLEDRICNLVSLTEIANSLVFDACEDAGADQRQREHAILIMDVVLERLRAFKAQYVAWYDNPPTTRNHDSDGHAQANGPVLGAE